MSGSSAPRARVLMIGLDAAEPSLLEGWMADGTLPHLQRLCSAGAYGRLSSTADVFGSSIWPCFLTGVGPGQSGAYHFLQWSPERMAMRRWGRGWIDPEPFWRSLGGLGIQVTAVDVPGPSPPSHGRSRETSGWSCIPKVHPAYAYPPDLLRGFGTARRRELRKMATRLLGEVNAPRPLARALEEADTFVESTRQTCALAVDLMGRDPWDLFIAVYSAAHRGGHGFWDASGLSDGGGREAERALRECLKRTYVACDEAVGRHLEAVPEDTTVLVFSLHGMAANRSRSFILEAMLRRILSDGRPAAVRSAPGLLKRLRQAVPIEWRSAVKTRLPLGIQDRLSLFWRTARRDWSRTWAFPVPVDLEGYVRINLRGREAKGVVEPGRDYEALCDRIEEGVSTFVDADTGEPLVAEVVRIDEAFGGQSRRAALPDLVLRWAPTPARHRRVTSPRFGSIDWPTPGKVPTGRSGNHTAIGFVMARGPGIAPGTAIEGGHILDLPPTVLALLGEAAPPVMTGRVLHAVVGPTVQPDEHPPTE